MSEALLNMENYRLPGGKNIINIYPPLPGLEKTGFDVRDYNYLFNDKATVELIRTGKTIGCFYIESPGMRSLLTRLNVNTFELLVAASSIIRPGVAESGMMNEFIERHKNPRKRTYLTPKMKEILGETYGVMIYQEDVIKVAHHIAGLTLEEADLLRRAMSGKMRSKQAMEQIENRFFESCKSKGLTIFVAKELWRQIKSFAGYSFCKSHSASFALLSYQVAYLKVHYPAEFMAAVLSNGGGYYSAAVYIQEAKRIGVEVKLPCVNLSGIEYEAKGRSIVIGLNAIKNLSKLAVGQIIIERSKNGKYTGLADFIVRTKTGFEDCVKLITCGAMDCFALTRHTLLRLLDLYFNERKLLDDTYNSLFMGDSFALETAIKTTGCFSIEEKCLAELRAFDYMVTKHPLEFFNAWVDSPAIVKAADIHKYHGKKVKLVGWFMAAKRIKTKKGEAMKFLSLEDLTGTFEAVLFPKTYSIYAEKTLSMGAYILEGRVDSMNGNNLIVEKLELVKDSIIESTAPQRYSESSYTGDNEKIDEREFDVIKSLDKDKMLLAYAKAN